jgi:hypothetical protein
VLFLPIPHGHCPFSPFCWSCLRETYGDICQSILLPNPIRYPPVISYTRHTFPHHSILTPCDSIYDQYHTSPHHLLMAWPGSSPITFIPQLGIRPISHQSFTPVHTFPHYLTLALSPYIIWHRTQGMTASQICWRVWQQSLNYPW